MATQADFWGQIQVDDIRTPVAILREQAALLGPKTHSLVEARVVTQASGNSFTHSFNLVVPALDNYTYQLFAISHPISLYPVAVPSQGTILDDEVDFTGWLQAKLSSPETKRTIASLIAQVRDRQL